MDPVRMKVGGGGFVNPSTVDDLVALDPASNGGSGVKLLNAAGESFGNYRYSTTASEWLPDGYFTTLLDGLDLSIGASRIESIGGTPPSFGTDGISYAEGDSFGLNLHDPFSLDLFPAGLTLTTYWSWVADATVAGIGWYNAMGFGAGAAAHDLILASGAAVVDAVGSTHNRIAIVYGDRSAPTRSFFAANDARTSYDFPSSAVATVGRFRETLDASIVATGNPGNTPHTSALRNTNDLGGWRNPHNARGLYVEADVYPAKLTANATFKIVGFNYSWNMP